MKYYYPFSAKKLKCENVCCEGYSLFKEYLNSELSAQVIKEAINMFAYLS